VFDAPILLTEISIAQIVGAAIGTLVAFPYVKDLIKIEFKFYKRLFGELFHFGKYTFGTSISSMLMRSTDSWMLGRLLSTAAVAVYNPALKLANIFEVPTIAITTFIFPQVAKKMKDRGKAGVRDVYVKSVSLMLAITIPMVAPLYFFSDFFVTTIFGESYKESADILEVTVFYSLIIPFNRQFGITMDALKKPKLNFYSLVIAALLNVVFNFFFLKLFGIVGCAYGTLLSFALLFVWNQFVLYKHFRIQTWSVIEHIFKWYATGWNMFTARMLQLANFF
jgi:O-antigen/teichoic acid export membrane protein